MNSILTIDPPDLSETNPKISPVVSRIVRCCLAKKPEQRFQSASDLSFALEALTSADARPASVAQVATALPSADPLAAAIAVGETPSPEMVAASGSKEEPWEVLHDGAGVCKPG